MFADVRKFTELASYNGSYDPSDSHSNIMEGATTTNADIWPGGHGVAGWAMGMDPTVTYTPFASANSGSAKDTQSYSWTTM